jgi:hypothetical protein
MKMGIKIPVYEDGVIAIALVSETPESAKKLLFNIAIRYLPPESYFKNGEVIATTNKMGGETDWFVIPFSFSSAIGRQLIEQKVSGLQGFNESGFSRMIEWLIEMNEIDDAMGY